MTAALFTVNHRAAGQQERFNGEVCGPDIKATSCEENTLLVVREKRS